LVAVAVIKEWGILIFCHQKGEIKVQKTIFPSSVQKNSSAASTKLNKQLELIDRQ
jgi:hypothetical protein